MVATFLRRMRTALRQPLFLTIQRILEYVPGRPVGIHRFYVLRLDHPRLRSVRGYRRVRAGVPEDVPAMARLEPKPAEEFVRRFEDGDECAVAVHDDEVVGYAWFTDRAEYVEDRFEYPFPIPPDVVFGYDAYIAPHFRLRGIWPQMETYMWDAAHRMGRRSIEAMIDYGNWGSLKAHRRFGYRVIKRVTAIRFRRHWRFLEDHDQTQPEIPVPPHVGR